MMKRFFQLTAVVLFAGLLTRCTQVPSTCDKCREPKIEHRPYSAGDWSQGDDHVAYVSRFERAPAAVPLTRYTTKGTCGGFPRIAVKTAPGFCVGLVFDGSGKFRKLRWAAPLTKSRALVTEMGGWAQYNGQILLLSFATAKSAVKPLLTRASFKPDDPRRGIINEPNQISRGPDGLYYVGAMNGIYRFNPKAADVVSSVEVLVDDLPSTGLHPLKSFTFDNKGNLYVNVGSASNVCLNFTRFGDRDPKKNPANFERRQFDECPEAENLQIGQGQIRRYTFQADGKLDKNFTVFAKGLRNSIALTWDEGAGVVIEGENGRDAINAVDTKLDNDQFPHERINVLREGAHYGWPYCYDQGKNSPEWMNIDCSKYEKSQLLIPGHSAPLGMIVYNGGLFPKWYKGRVMLALHGYAPQGHRLVTFKRDDRGLPTGVPQSVIYGWEKRGSQGIGKPVGVTQLDDGSLMIVEDDPQNKILRLFYDPKLGRGTPVEEINHPGKPKISVDIGVEETRKNNLDNKINSGKAPPFALFEAKVIDKTCYMCHQAEGAPGVQLVRYDDVGNEKRIRDAGKAEDILKVVSGADGAPAMPPQGWSSPEEQAEAVQLLKEWLGQP